MMHINLSSLACRALAFRFCGGQSRVVLRRVLSVLVRMEAQPAQAMLVFAITDSVVDGERLFVNLIPKLAWQTLKT